MQVDDIKIPKLSAKQNKFILELAVNGSIKKACQIAGISEKTGHNWLKDEDFNKTLHDIRETLVSRSLNSLMMSLDKAVNAVLRILDDERTSTMAKLSAARLIIENSLKFREQQTLLQRVEELEKQMKGVNTL
jgi:translation initiation factor 2B subunit (eIF-2B alpha/beta/delta family)